ncbi:hypothetical protein F4W70_18395 [Pseudomonas cannabina]|nr:hypothetical protein F4W70_18395 [Pseudomonas cannabina]SDR45935.1 hypothetical protein SAMN05216597_5045 [Pseudomonas cannabina]
MKCRAICRLELWKVISLSTDIKGFCPEGVGEDRATLRLSAMGCEADLKQVIQVVSDVPYAPVLLPVPGSSRTSEASLGPSYRNRYIVDKRSVARSAPSFRLNQRGG